MPLDIISSTTLSIPESAFGADHLAAVQLAGGRYSGNWVIAVSQSADGPRLGELHTHSSRSREKAFTADSGYPYLALETAFTWLSGETRRLGWRIIAWECLNHLYSEPERPYFCLAQAIIGDSGFVPAPGRTYPDEMSLDQVMGYSR